MDESILNDVKKLIGIAIANSDFDQDLIIDTNAVLFDMWQMGILVDDYSISDATKTWSEVLLNPDKIALNPLKTWTALKVKLIFDPPTSSILLEAIQENLKELQWRIYITENYVGEIQNA